MTDHGPATISSPLWGIFTRDLVLPLRRRSEAVQPLIFFVVVAALFPLGVSPDPDLLRQMGGGVIWVGALLASFMSLELLFRSDYDDGGLDQMLLSSSPLMVLVVAKLSAHWLLSGLPLLAISPVLGTLYDLPSQSLWILFITLALGTPVLTLVGGIGTALTVGLKRGGALLALLVLPLYIPVLIFGAQAVSTAGTGLPVTGQLYVLGAFLALALSLAPPAIAAALRVGAG